MVLFVVVTQSGQYLNGFGNRGRVDHNRLKPPGQCAIFFDVFTVFIDRCGTDTLNLSPRKRRLENIGSIEAALGTAGTDNGVQFINKNYNIIIFLQLDHERLETLFELPAVLGAGYHAGHI